MKFTLKNIGRLGEAEIDLGKKLIVLVGPNNTSKTYLSYAVYGFCKELGRSFRGINLSFSLIDQMMRAGTGEIDLRVLLNPVAALVEPIVQAAPNWLARTFAAEATFAAAAKVEFQFAVEAHNLEKWVAVLTDSVFMSGATTLTFVKGSTSDRVAYKVMSGPESDAADTLEAEPSSSVGANSIMIRFALQQTVGVIFEHLYKPFILSAERTAIQLFGKEISASRADSIGADAFSEIQSKAARGDDPLTRLVAAAGRYSRPIQDGLRAATRWEHAKKLSAPPEISKLADNLEAILLGGAASTDDNGDIKFTPSDGDPIKLHLASSSVKSLVPLVLYLRHLASPDDFLIIDEPELNLHPDNQRRMARVLAQIANAGLKVMVTTHSDYVIRELNNLIMLSSDHTREVAMRHNYSKDMTLAAADVGAYMFSSKSAAALPVTETGFEVETIDRELNSLNHVSQDIYFSLFEKTV